jgi:hypothetical protein
LQGKKKANDYVSYYLALDKASVCTWTNIGYVEQSEADLIESLKDEWCDKPLEEIFTYIMKAQAVDAQTRCPRDAIIVKCHTTLIKYRKLQECKASTIAGMKKFADLSKHVDINAVAEQMKSLTVWTMDVITGTDIQFSLFDFMKDGLLVKYSLIMMGAPQLGKTPVCQMMSAYIARGMQQRSHDEEAYYIQTGTVEGLSKVSALLADNIPILFDDLTPNSSRKGRAAMTPEALKHIFNVQSSGVVDARYADIAVPENCARLITTNALTPHEWLPELPHGLRGMKPSVRVQSCSGDALAILKRCAFVLVETSFISSSKREAYWQEAQNQASAKMARVLPP